VESLLKSENDRLKEEIKQTVTRAEHEIANHTKACEDRLED
jgi:hypothetical protein